MPMILRSYSSRYVFDAPDGHYEIILTGALLRTLLKYRQTRRRKEAGGILLGRMWPQRIAIEQASEPGIGDRAGRYFFERNSLRAQKIIHNAWCRSHGEVNYLGEWHSHPEAHPKPSLRDKAMIQDVFEGAHVHRGSVLLLILGTQSLWVGIQTQNGLSELKAQ